MKGRKVWILSHGWNGALDVMNQIGMRLSSKPEITVSLDPPSDPCPGGYNVEDPDGFGNETKKSDLNKGGKKTRSFVGAQSVSGSQEHNRTAKLSGRIDFHSSILNPEEHGWVQESWQIMLNTDRLESNILGATDNSEHTNWTRRDEFGLDLSQDNHFLLTMKKPTNTNTITSGDVEYLEYSTSLGTKTIYKINR